MVMKKGGEGVGVKLKHPLKKTDHMIASFNDQSILRNISAGDFEAKFFVKCL
jgi:hypothetical protein